MFFTFKDIKPTFNFGTRKEAQAPKPVQPQPLSAVPAPALPSTLDVHLHVDEAVVMWFTLALICLAIVMLVLAAKR